MQPLLDAELLEGVNAKVCNICKQLKHIEEYHPNKVCKLRVVGTCKSCYKIRITKWYKDNRDKRQQYANERNRSRKQFWIEYKGGKCEDCGGEFPPCVFDFHHEGLKDMNPSSAITMSFENQKKELDKCILLCANCHRIRHFDRKEGVNHATID